MSSNCLTLDPIPQEKSFVPRGKACTWHKTDTSDGFVTPSGSKSLAQKIGPQSSTRKFNELLPELQDAAKALSDEEVQELWAEPRRGFVLHTASGGSFWVTKGFIIEHRFSLSRRTAYRCIKSGKLPSADRRIGRDGKTYPAHPRREVA